GVEKKRSGQAIGPLSSDAGVRAAAAIFGSSWSRRAEDEEEGQDKGNVGGPRIALHTVLLSTEPRQEVRTNSASGVDDDGAGLGAMSCAVLGADVPKALTTPRIRVADVTEVWESARARESMGKRVRTRLRLRIPLAVGPADLVRRARTRRCGV